MTSLQKNLNRILLFRWEAMCTCVVLALAIPAWNLCFPVAGKTAKDVAELAGNITVINKADSIAALADETRKQADALDSTIKATEGRQQFTEGTLPGELYNLTAKAGIKASRVEIAVSSGTQEGRQLPVRFTGTGEYNACGMFIDGIESLSPAARIRVMSMKNVPRGAVELFLDFVVMGE
jgi:hypothetical protein